MREARRRATADPWFLYSCLVVLAAAVFVGDLYTPVDIAVWTLYVLPIGLTLLARNPSAPIIGAAGCTLLMGVTLFTDTPGVTPRVAYVNRGCGLVVIWTIAALARNLIDSRNCAEAEEWLRGVQARLLEAMQGARSLPETGERMLDVIAVSLTASVAVLYASEDAKFRLVASMGLQPGAQVPETFRFGEGWVGEAARRNHVSVLNDLPDSFFPTRSSLASGTPRHLVVAPLVACDATQGVLELRFLHPPDERCLTLLERTRDALASAIRTAFYRDRLRALLDETQRQAEELQVQQEELRVANEELEERSRALSSSHARLEEHQGQLEATNAQLELRAGELEQQKGALFRANREAERASQHKSEFLASMSHELRTPLNSALILAKLLAQNAEGRLSHQQVRYAETIYTSGNHLLNIINDILNLAKIESGAVEVEPVSLSPHAIVDDLHRTFQPIASEKRLEFTVDVSPGAPGSVTTDDGRLRQILTNLLSNAFKFTDQGGVVLRVAPAEAGTLAFEVRDTGGGIPKDRLRVIFDAFRQADGSTHRQYGGTGLGLSIARELATLLGGDIRVESDVGAGSTFRLTIPIELQTTSASNEGSRPFRPFARAPSGRTGADAQSPPAPQARAPSIPVDDRDHRRHPGRLILAVEDDAGFSRILYDLAHELDFDCVLAASNDEGMALARDQSPDAIILDVGLPDGSGLTLLDRLKRSPGTRHIPVHVVSASDQVQTALKLGAVGYAVKPVERDELRHAIQKLEQRLDQRVRRVLVVESDDQLRTSMKDLLQIDRVVVHDVATPDEALRLLAAERFDCVVLDLDLPDAMGYDILEAMSANEQYSFPPVIVYTGRQMSREDEERLRRFSRSVIVKGARSPEGLLHEVTLFLHQVESRLPLESQRLLRAARERDDLFEGKTILIVEDDVRNIFALTSVFEPRGAKVVIARNGREGIDQVEKSRPDLVLMDIMMPEMDGLSATRALRKTPEWRTLPIIALTAKATTTDYQQCVAAGVNDYLAKPLDVDKLVSLCRVWMSR